MLPCILLAGGCNLRHELPPCQDVTAPGGERVDAASSTACSLAAAPAALLHSAVPGKPLSDPVSAGLETPAVSTPASPSRSTLTLRAAAPRDLREVKGDTRIRHLEIRVRLHAAVAHPCINPTVHTRSACLIETQHAEAACIHQEPPKQPRMHAAAWGQVSQLKAELAAHAHALRKEVGEDVPLERVLAEGSDWRGRAQRISTLKERLLRLHEAYTQVCCLGCL